MKIKIISARESEMVTELEKYDEKDYEILNISVRGAKYVAFLKEKKPSKAIKAKDETK